MHTLEKSADLKPLFDQIESDNIHYVLLGEASHGTSEFYKWRAEITKHLVSEKGFSFIAVEGDWPDCYRVNRYVKGISSDENAYDILYSFNRWPTWMWANREILDLIEWLKGYNTTLSEEKKVGFYGLDVYSLWESLEAVIKYLKS
jgi:erythromycin esterase